MRRVRNSCLLLVLVAGPLQAQTITGFAGLTWGTPPDSAIAHYGKPLQSGTDESAASWLLFNDHVLSRDVQVYLLFTPDHGLIKGAYAVPFGMGNDCAVSFSTFKQAISDRYPSIRAEESKTTSAEASR
jgi:hypothetical protein